MSECQGGVGAFDAYGHGAVDVGDGHPAGVVDLYDGVGRYGRGRHSGYGCDCCCQ